MNIEKTNLFFLMKTEKNCNMIKTEKLMIFF